MIDPNGPWAHELAASRLAFERAAAEGDLATARQLASDLLASLPAGTDPVVRDRLLCDVAALSIELGEPDDHLAELRAILLRSTRLENARLAAYALARSHELAGTHAKGLFYARIARDHSLSLARPDWLASSHNQVGNLLVAGSRFADAREEYRAALGHLGEERSLRRFVILQNLGYCAAVLGERDESLRLLYQALRGLVAAGARRHETQARLDLCYAHLELGRLELGQRHAERALELASELGDDEARRNALFLLGAALRSLGRSDTARFVFRQLQSDFYPDQDYLPGLLESVDGTGLLNLRR